MLMNICCCCCYCCRYTWLAEYEGEVVLKLDHISDYAWKVSALYCMDKIYTISRFLSDVIARSISWLLILITSVNNETHVNKMIGLIGTYSTR